MCVTEIMFLDMYIHVIIMYNLITQYFDFLTCMYVQCIMYLYNFVTQYFHCKN